MFKQQGAHNVQAARGPHLRDAPFTGSVKSRHPGGPISFESFFNKSGRNDLYDAIEEPLGYQPIHGSITDALGMKGIHMVSLLRQKLLHMLGALI
jgi:hypothetical protein